MLHVSELEGPVEGNASSAGRLDVAEDIEPSFVPGKGPGKNGREEDDREPVGKVGHPTVAWLKGSFEGPRLSDVLECLAGPKTYRKTIMMAKAVKDTAAVKP